MAIKVIHKRDQTGGEHDLPHPQVYVGRPSPLGNPYAIGKDGTRGEVIELYREWIEHTMKHDPESAASKEFDRIVHMYIANGSIDLVCWCAPQACHADVIKDLLQDFMDGMDKYYRKLDEEQAEMEAREVRDGDW